DCLRLALREKTLQTDHRSGGLFRVRAGADAEINNGFWHSKVFEEDFGHCVVIVLARVTDSVFDTRSAECGVDGSCLDEIRARSDNGNDHKIEFITSSPGLEELPHVRN